MYFNFWMKWTHRYSAHSHQKNSSRFPNRPSNLPKTAPGITNLALCENSRCVFQVSSPLVLTIYLYCWLGVVCLKIWSCLLALFGHSTSNTHNLCVPSHFPIQSFPILYGKELGIRRSRSPLISREILRRTRQTTVLGRSRTGSSVPAWHVQLPGSSYAFGLDTVRLPST